MTPKRLHYALIASLALVGIAMIGSVVIISQSVTAKSTQLAASRTNVEQLTATQNGIAKSKRDISTYSQLAAITKTIVPQDKDQAAAVREITAIAAANGVVLNTLTFPSSSLGTRAGAAGAAPAPAATTRPNLSQLTPVTNIPGVYALQIIMGNNPNNPVTYNRLSAFLKGLENNRRTASVSTIDIQPQNSNPNNLVFTLTVNTYIKP